MMTTDINASVIESHKRNEQAAYDPNHLLDTLRHKLNLKTDAALSRALEVHPPVISKIRRCRLPVGASLLLRMHEISDISVAELRALMARNRHQTSLLSDNQFDLK